VYDADARAAELEQALDGVLSHSNRIADDESRTLLPVIALTVAGKYAEARTTFDAIDGMSDGRRRAFRKQISAQLLAPRSLEWTVHGPQRCFRFWTPAEKVKYIEFAASVAWELKDLTPSVCFGFGAALAVVRDGEPIPHDDDLDIIIGFEPHEAGSLPDGLRRVAEFLRERGFTVAGNFSAHRHVSKAGHKHVDVFVGLFEGDVVSWYPGARGALTRQMMFPTSEASLLGVEVPLPRNPLVYLEKVYGEGWRRPDPGFKHTWDRSAYADLAKKKA
jgi:hypothetical protein